MSKEEIVRDRFLADETLRGLAEGGIYIDELVGVEGLRRGEHSPTNPAFLPDGSLKPTILIRQGGILPYGNVRSQKDKIVAVSQLVSVFYFQMRGHEIIDAMKQRGYVLLEHVRLGKTYPAWWAFETPPVPDSGPVLNSTVLRQDWMVVFMRSPDGED